MHGHGRELTAVVTRETFRSKQQNDTNSVSYNVGKVLNVGWYVSLLRLCSTVHKPTTYTDTYMLTSLLIVLVDHCSYVFCYTYCYAHMH